VAPGGPRPLIRVHARSFAVQRDSTYAKRPPRERVRSSRHRDWNIPMAGSTCPGKPFSGGLTKHDAPRRVG
jgi:hypothetical protein